MADDTYQGWTNRETWCVHLWLTNEVALYAGTIAAARAVDTFHPENVENYTRDALDEWSEASDWTLDLLNCALARVNWREVSDALRET